MLHDQLFYTRGITTWVASNMLYEYFYLFTGEKQLLRVFFPQDMTVNIAKHSPKRAESPEFFDNIHIAKVSRVPDLVALFEMFKNLFIKESMGV